MRPGETQKFSCDTCVKDFEITLEPNAPHAEDATPKLCPFCGDDIVERQIGEAAVAKPAPRPKKGTKRENLQRKASEAAVAFKEAWAEVSKAEGDVKGQNNDR